MAAPARSARPRTRRLRPALSLLAAALSSTASAAELSWSSASPTSPAEASAVAADAAGGLVVCGSWRPREGGETPFAASFSAAGVQRWQRIDAWPERARARRCAAVALDGAADVYMVANAPADGERAAAFAVLKLDGASGATVWRQALDAEPRGEATSMRVAADGAVYVGGFSRSSPRSSSPSDATPAQAPDLDGFVLRLDAATGELAWRSRVASANGGDDRVFGVDADAATGAVFAVGDTTGGALAAGAEPEPEAGAETEAKPEAEAEPLHAGDLFVGRLDAGTGAGEWLRTVGERATAELCRLSAASVAGSAMAAGAAGARRGNCAVAVSPGASHVFATGTTVGGALSTDAGERRELQRLCAPRACVHALLARVDARSGETSWLRQLVSRAGSSGERVEAQAPVAANGSAVADAVLLAVVDAGFHRADAMEQLVVLRAAGDTGDPRWRVDLGGPGPDRALGLARSVSPAMSGGSGDGDAAVLVLSAGARRRGAAEPVTTTLRRLDAHSGAAQSLCRDAITFGAAATTVERPATQALVVALPVFRVGGARCGTGDGDSAAGGAPTAVTYATADGSARGHVDFVPSRGVVPLAPAREPGDQQVLAAHIAVQVLPRAADADDAADSPVAFTVRLEAAPGAPELLAPAALRVVIEPRALAVRARTAAASGAFWRRLTHLGTLAAAGALLLLLALRVGCGRRLAWARARAAFEYRTLSVRTPRRRERARDSDDDEGKARRARWWRWRWRRGSSRAGRGRARQPSAGAMASDAADAAQPGVQEGRGASGVAAAAQQEEEELRSHLASIQNLNESLERLLLAPQASPPPREGAAVVAPIGEEPAARLPRRQSKRRGLRMLLRSPRARRHSGDGEGDGLERGG